ncbi:hypothetical protein RSAG8_05183, partial [Rhizoctonia solani AG-8 WAC10335]
MRSYHFARVVLERFTDLFVSLMLVSIMWCIK